MHLTTDQIDSVARSGRKRADLVAIRVVSTSSSTPRAMGTTVCSTASTLLPRNERGVEAWIVSHPSVVSMYNVPGVKAEQLMM
jgi:hypothetical protein